MSSLMGAGAAASGGVVATTGIVVTSVVAGAAASLVFMAGATKAAENATQPNPTSANLTDVSQPRYADE